MSIFRMFMLCSHGFVRLEASIISFCFFGFFTYRLTPPDLKEEP